jgi:SAM-dependent methyltransferase
MPDPQPEDVSLPSFWSTLYQTGDTGWDKGRCAPPIARLLREDVVPPGARLAVIGCGRGHEALEAARLGYQVTAIDFAPEAIAAVTGSAREQRLDLLAVEADVFDLARRWPEHFDAILEHTCLCAVDPTRRDEYVTAVAGALKPLGLLLGLFYACDKPTSPPYTIDEAEVRSRFIPRFEFVRLCTAPDSFEHRAGNELEFIARRRA